MTKLNEVIVNHIEYTIWATNRLLHAAAELSEEERRRDFGTADKSIEGTLTHLLRSERTWFLRIRDGTPRVPWALPNDEEWDHLMREWPHVHRQWRDWASGLSEQDAEEALTYKDLKGNDWTQPIWQIVLHVVNHSTHHRGQVTGFLRAVGKTPPPLDFIAFVRGV